MGKKNQNRQNALAARELRGRGVSEARIAELEADWIEHAKNQGRVEPGKTQRSS